MKYLTTNTIPIIVSFLLVYAFSKFIPYTKDIRTEDQKRKEEDQKRIDRDLHLSSVYSWFIWNEIFKPKLILLLKLIFPVWSVLKGLQFEVEQHRKWRDQMVFIAIICAIISIISTVYTVAAYYRLQPDCNVILLVE